MEYAQARIQARFGARPGEGDWLRIQSATDFAAALDIAQRSPLNPWSSGLTPASGAHEIERAARNRLRRLIAEVAGWVPGEWREAVAFLDQLLLLRPLAALAAGGERRPWMLADERLAPFAAAEDVFAALETNAYRYLASAWRRERAGDVVDAADLYARALRAWLAEWRARWPAQDAEEHAAIERLEALALRHVDALARARAQDSRALHRTLAERLRVAFRRGASTPVAVFSFLALEALDAARARAELLRHAALARAGIAP